MSGSRFLAVLCAFAALAAAGARAETVFVQEFALENQEVALSCDVEKLLARGFAEKGCDLVTPTGSQLPDLIVTGSYRNKGSRVYATLSVADTVSSRTVYSASHLLPTDEAQCGELAARISEGIEEGSTALSRKKLRDQDTGMDFVFVPGGSFRMGKSEELGSYISVGGFFLADREVTQAQYKRVMGHNPSFFQGDDLPVENVSWLDAMEFVRLLSERTGRVYRLPSEAEWEYAARSRGRNFTWAGTNQKSNLGHFAWTEANSGRRTHPAGAKRPNGLGLFDMSGNVWEWCSDRPVTGASREGMGERSANRVIRGGSWMMDDTYATSYSRDSSSPETRYQDNGFRLVMEEVPPKPPAVSKPGRTEPRGAVAKQ